MFSRQNGCVLLICWRSTAASSLTTLIHWIIWPITFDLWDTADGGKPPQIFHLCTRRSWSAEESTGGIFFLLALIAAAPFPPSFTQSGFNRDVNMRVHFTSFQFSSLFSPQDLPPVTPVALYLSLFVYEIRPLSSLNTSLIQLRPASLSLLLFTLQLPVFFPSPLFFTSHPLVVSSSPPRALPHPFPPPLFPPTPLVLLRLADRIFLSPSFCPLTPHPPSFPSSPSLALSLPG